MFGVRRRRLYDGPGNRHYRRRVPRFWQVDFHPYERTTEQMAEKGLLTPLNRLVHCGNVVTRAYSQRLRSGPPLEALTSWGRFVLREHAQPFAPKPDRGFSANLGMGEVWTVPPPPLEWLDLPDTDRRRALLGFLHDHLVTLAKARQWDQEPLQLAYDGLLRDGIEYGLSTPAKSSPDRRHTAVARMHCDGEGDYWLRLVARDKEGSVVAESPLLVTGGETRDFNDAKRTLRWLDKSTVTVTPWPDSMWSKYRKPFVLSLTQQ